MTDFIFTSYCFDNSAAEGSYMDQQARLEESILSIYPVANIDFHAEPEATGKPRFQKSLYGFKVELVKRCLANGFKKIIFLDTAMTLNDRVDHWLELAAEHGVLAAVDRQTLNNVSSDAVLQYCGLSREQAAGVNLVGGSMYVFDFNNPKCEAIFKTWSDMEAKGLFGTQDDLSAGKLQGHRMDETCMALSLYLNGSRPMGHDEMRYTYVHPVSGLNQTTWMEEVKPIAIKKHFK